MHHHASRFRFTALALLLAALAGCSTIAEKTNFMSDSDVRSKVAGTLGYTPEDLTVISRRTEGTNTYVVVKVKNKKEFACTLNGGNLLSAGMVNPPSCTPRA